MPNLRAYSSARAWSRLATARRSTRGDACAPGISLRLMLAVEMIPHVVIGVVSRAMAGEIGVGMLGYAFMGKAHSNAFRKLAYMTWPPPLVPKLEVLAGRNEEAVREAAERYGYERWTIDWREAVGDPAVGLFDNGGPNAVHAEP